MWAPTEAGPCFNAGAGLITVTERAKRVCGWAARWGRYHAGAWYRDGRRPTQFRQGGLPLGPAVLGPSNLKRGTRRAPVAPSACTGGWFMGEHFAGIEAPVGSSLQHLST